MLNPIERYFPRLHYLFFNPFRWTGFEDRDSGINSDWIGKEAASALAPGSPDYSPSHPSVPQPVAVAASSLPIDATIAHRSDRRLSADTGTIDAKTVSLNKRMDEAIDSSQAPSTERDSQPKSVADRTNAPATDQTDIQYLERPDTHQANANCIENNPIELHHRQQTGTETNPPAIDSSHSLTKEPETELEPASDSVSPEAPHQRIDRNRIADHQPSTHSLTPPARTAHYPDTRDPHRNTAAAMLTEFTNGNGGPSPSTPATESSLSTASATIPAPSGSSATNSSDATNDSAEFEAWALLKQGIEQMGQGNAKVAIAYYHQALTLCPNLTEGYQYLAEAYTHQGQLPEAAECYRRAIELSAQDLLSKPNPSTESASLTNGLPDSASPTLPISNGATVTKEATPLPAEVNSFPDTATSSDSIVDPSLSESPIALTDESAQPTTALLESPNLAAPGQEPSQPDPRPEEKAAIDEAEDEDIEEDDIPWFEEAAFHLQQGEVLCNAGKWEDAMSASQKALSLLGPESANAYLLIGRALQGQGKLKEAEQSYEKALILRPEFAEVFARIGSIYDQQQRYTEAADRYQQAISVQPKFAGAHLKLAEVWQKLGNVEKAAASWYRAYQLEPQWATPQEHMQLGNTLASHNKLDQAMECYRTAIRLNPNYAEAYHNMGEALGRQGRWYEALTYHRQAVKLDQSNTQLYTGLGRTLMALGQWEEAGSCFERAIKLDASNASAYIGLRDVLIKLGRWEKVLRSPSILLGMGDALLSHQRWEEAMSCFQQVLALDANQIAAHLGVGKALTALNQWEPAISSYQRVIQLDPNATEGYAGLRQALVKLGRWEEALPCYRKLIQLQPDSGSIYHELGDLLNRLQRWEEAVPAFKKAIQLNPEFSWSYNNLGDALLQLERWEEATAAYRQAAKLNPEFHWSFYNLGEACSHLEQWDEAIAAYRRAYDLQSDLPYILSKLGDSLYQRAKSDVVSALQCYRKAIEQDPRDVQNYHKAIEIQPDEAGLYLGLGNALVLNNRVDEAIVFYQMAKQLEPEHQDVSLQLEKALEKKKLGGSGLA